MSQKNAISRTNAQRMPKQYVGMKAAQDAAPTFTYAKSDFEQLARDAMDHARSLGGTASVVELSESSGLALTVRRRKVETVEQTRDKGLGITVYVGTRRGHASTSDFSREAMERTVQAAHDIARVTGEDPFARLPEESLLAFDAPEPDLYSPWYITAPAGIELAQRLESAAFDTSPRIVNSDGASVSVHHGHFLMANSLGFSGGYPYSRHTIACAPIARQGSQMQRDDWYSSERDARLLADPEAVGRYAAERALARLQPRRIESCKVPVLFEAPLACGILGAFTQAVSGSALYRRSTFLVDSLGKSIFAAHVDIDEDPDIPGAFGTGPFDDEGVRTKARRVVDGGVVQGYFLSCYSARKLGMQTTGNAGGSHNLSLSSRLTKPSDDMRAMLKKMNRGLLVTELMGQGVNYVNGDYSRGASGYWVENGEIVHAVEEITIASNLRDMFAGIVAIGSDTLVRGTKTTGSILIESMSIGS